MFARKGYQATTLSEIARGARVSPANVYVYFGSKLKILYAIYEPWLRARLSRLEQRLGRVANRRERLRRLLTALWRDIPAERNGFANNWMQAASTSTPEEGYRPELLEWVEETIAAMLRDTLPPGRRAVLGHARFTHVLMMAQDGFVINRHLRPKVACSNATIEMMCRLMLGAGPTARYGRRRAAAPRRP